MARSFESLLWSRIIAAFAGSSSEAVSAAVVNVGSRCGLSRQAKTCGISTSLLSSQEAISVGGFEAKDVVQDLYFLHERGGKTGIYMSVCHHYSLPI
jgi:hypothetical protein